MPSDPKARTRVRIALLLLFVFMVAASVGTYYVADLGRLQDLIAARQGQAARALIPLIRQFGSHIFPPA